MLSPNTIIAWLAGKVNGMRRSRLKTLADLVAAAMWRAGGFSRLLKANTVAGRVLPLATIGFLAMKKLGCSTNTASRHLRLGQCQIKTGDC